MRAIDWVQFWQWLLLFLTIMPLEDCKKKPPWEFFVFTCWNFWRKLLQEGASFLLSAFFTASFSPFNAHLACSNLLKHSGLIILPIYMVSSYMCSMQAKFEAMSLSSFLSLSRFGVSFALGSQFFEGFKKSFICCCLAFTIFVHLFAVVEFLTFL